MDREDIILMIEAADSLEDFDEVLRVLSGSGHGGGRLYGLDNVYELLLKYSHEYYRDENAQELFFRIIEDRKKSPEERADILMNGTVRYDENDNIIDFPMAK